MFYTVKMNNKTVEGTIAFIARKFLSTKNPDIQYVRGESQVDVNEFIRAVKRTARQLEHDRWIHERFTPDRSRLNLKIAGTSQISNG